MNDPKHTPGPLSFREALPQEVPSLLLTSPAAFVVESGISPIALVLMPFVCDGPTGKIAEANACLIAAATDLKEALKTMLDDPLNPNKIKIARAALAKAGGAPRRSSA